MMFFDTYRRRFIDVSIGAVDVFARIKLHNESSPTKLR